MRRSLALLLLPMILAAAPAEPRSQALSLGLVLKVEDRDKTADLLLDKLEAMGGHFAGYSDRQLDARVPVAQVAEFLAVAEGQGVVIDRSRESRDLEAQLIEVRARLKARENTLQEIQAMLAGASREGLATLRAQLAHSVGEIETLKGRLQMFEHQLRFARVTVAFEFLDRTLPPPPTQSSFAWLNSLRVERLLSDGGAE